jgi:hypothetical protein
LRSIGKFNTRHLWCNNEIAKSDQKVIWELLDDIWHYYTSKNILTNDAKIKKTQSLKNINILKTKEIINNSSDDIHTPEPENSKYVENYYSLNKNKTFEKYTDLINYQKMITNNINKVVHKNTNSLTPRENVLEDCLGIKKKHKLK